MTDESERVVATSTTTDDDKIRWKSHKWDALTVGNIVTSSSKFVRLKATRNPEEFETDTFVVNVDLLCHFSPYYRAALKGSFQETGKDFLEVEVDADILKMVAVWLYTGALVDGSDASPKPNQLIHLYVFADQYDFLALRRAVISEYPTCSGELATYEHVNHAYEALPADSPMLRHLISTFVFHWYIEDDDFDDGHYDRDSAPARFLSAVLAGREKHMHSASAKGEDRCDCCHALCSFHEHESKEERIATCGHDVEEDEESDVDDE